MIAGQNKGMRRRFRRMLTRARTNSVIEWRARSGRRIMQGQGVPSTAPWVRAHLLDERSRPYRGGDCAYCRIISDVEVDLP
jgi:hypothetical protein